MWQILSLSFAFTGILAWTRTHYKFSNEDASAWGEILNISKSNVFVGENILLDFIWDENRHFWKRISVVGALGEMLGTVVNKLNPKGFRSIYC